MGNIHLKTTIGLIYVFGFVSFSLLGLWFLATRAEGTVLWFSLAFGYAGVAILKESHDDLCSLVERDNFVLKALGYAYVVPSGAVFIFFWLFSYLILSPIYLIYFVGYILGKGINAANE